MKDHYDIGVVGCWYWGNYGSLLNGYATYSLLKEMNLSVLNIVTPNNGFEPHTKKFFSCVYNDDEISPVLPFDELYKFNNVCDMFLSGSDQLWNYNFENNIEYIKYFMLNFANDDKKKISFATSFGPFSQREHKEANEEFSKLLKRYSNISVRENEGVNICKEYYGVKATQLIEPVLAIDKQVWNNIADKSEKDPGTEPYILAYILDPTPQKTNAIKYYAEKMGVNIFCIVDGFSRLYEQNKQKMALPNILKNVWCGDFLKFFSKASYIITDSFHGVCFSILYNKPFLCFNNVGRGSARFHALLSKVGLMNRLVDSVKIPLEEKYLSNIDYSKINSIIEKERNKSKEWLHSVCFSTTKESAKLKNNIISRLPTEKCVGCGACMSICPTNAVHLAPDQQGYYKPVIDDAKCVECGVCINKCTAMELPVNLNAKTPLAYAFVCKNKNELMKSTSGGAFGVLARMVINRGGIVVGASFTDNVTVKHIIVETEDELNKLYKSKYLQSYVGDTYKKVKEILDSGKEVLFSGTPCQISGLKKYLGKTYKNLILVDVLCACAPSQKYFDKYIEEKFGKDNISQYVFRHKLETDSEWSHHNVKAIMSDGQENNILLQKYDYFDNIVPLISNHCMKCKYQGQTRMGDLTLGDCWGVQKFAPNIDPSLGVSLILINNEKGKELLESLPKEEIDVLQKVLLTEAKKYNVCAFQENRDWPLLAARTVFRQKINNEGYFYAINEALKISK